MRAMGHLPRPISPFRSHAIDPSVLHENSCDRDYGVLCPDGFLNIGNVKGGGKDYCFASPSYDGPCSSDAYAFEGLSSTAKGRWSELCKAAWPCKRCERNYKEQCPRDWQSGSDGRCQPSSSYMGPCRCAREPDVIFVSDANALSVVSAGTLWISQATT